MDHPVRHAPCTKRTTPVRTMVIDAMESAGEIPDGELTSMNRDSPAVPGPNAVCFGNIDEVPSHSAFGGVGEPFFHGMSRFGMGGGLGLATCSSGRPSGATPGGPMFSRQPASRAWSP